jgi:radical SAM protein with 4Fe4S-binding SPASM domain
MNIIEQLKKYLIKRSIWRKRLIKKQISLLKNTFIKYPLPHPRIIHIETRARCNSSCSFCLANYNDDPREDLLMDNNLVDKILSNLNEIDYSNRISFFNNNEPFLDKRIVEFIKKARNHVPKSYLELKSNGKGLKMKMILEIFNAGLDTLYINDYTDTKRHSKNVEKIMKELNSIRRFKGHMVAQSGYYNQRIIINKRRLTEELGTRAGTSPNQKFLLSSLDQPCFRPFEMMTISPEGIVGVCSEDFFYSTNMGNVNSEKILKIWNSDKYTKFRNELINGNRNVHDACSKCDYRGFTYEMFNEYGILPH